jgi:hypothetical protein
VIVKCLATRRVRGDKSSPIHQLALDPNAAPTQGPPGRNMPKAAKGLTPRSESNGIRRSKPEQPRPLALQ